MSGVDYEYEVQRRLIAKYGALYGVTAAIVSRIQDGTASAAERKTYDENARKLVEKFTSDLASLDLNDISTADAEIVVGLAAADHQTPIGKDETYSKILTPEGVTRMLWGPPVLRGFCVPSRFERPLSPPQIITQLGLSYSDNGTTPFLVDAGGALEPQSFVYVMETPITEEIREKAKVPIDPRLLEAVKQIAEDAARGPGDLIRRAAQEIANPAVSRVVLRDDGTGTRELADAFVKEGFAVDKPLGGPSTASSVPRYGTLGDIKEGYADPIQERTLGSAPVLCPAGTAIYIKVQTPAAPGLPAGSTQVKLYEWDGHAWAQAATDQKIEATNELARAGRPPEVQEQHAKRMLQPAKLGAACSAGRERVSLATPLPRMVKGEIAAGEPAVKGEIVNELSRSALVALAAVKLKKKPRIAAEKRKAKKLAEEKAAKRKAAAEEWARLAKKERQREAEERDEQQRRSSSEASEGGGAD